MDDSSIQKSWERPWSTDEMRAHCSNWNLAGDAGLLRHLQEFSQNLLQKTHTTEVALDSLLEDMRNTSVDVKNATNALLMISNNQFVENRVYDDCEEEKDDIEGKKVEDKSADVDEAVLIARAAEAISLGMSVIDTKFDCVEVPASDSEGEEDLESPGREGKDKKSFALVLEPRNPYMARPLPYLIGSKEFMEDDRIGLGDEEDEEEEEEEDEEEEEIPVSMGQDLAAQGLANDSGSSLAADIAEEVIFDEDEADERRVPKIPAKQQWASSSSSASDDVEVEKNRMRKKQKTSNIFGVKREEIDPFGRENEERDIFGKESSSDDEFFGGSHIDVEPSIPVKKQPVQKAFAEELAAKLGAVDDKKADNSTARVVKAKDDSKAERVAVPKTKSKTPSISSDNLFGPPKDDWNIDEDTDSLFADNDGMFSGGRGLFDDLNDSLLDNKPLKSTSSEVPSRIMDKPPPLKKEKEPSIFGGNDSKLFGDEDEDEEDMFSNVLSKTKPSEKMKKIEKVIAEEPQKRKPSASNSDILPPLATESDSKTKKFVEPTDSWLFEDDDQEDSLYKDVHSSKEKGSEIEESKRYMQDPVQEEQKEATPKKKLPAGARSFYANGIDPFALGKKVLKEVQDKQKSIADKEVGDNDIFNVSQSSSKEVIPKVAAKSMKTDPEKESAQGPKPSPKPRSLFEDLDDGDDLFAPVSSKPSKTKELQPNEYDSLFSDDLFAPKKQAGLAPDKSKEKEKSSTVRKGNLGDSSSKGLFGDSGSDDDDIFSCSSSLGSRSSASKIIPSKSTKVFTEPATSLFNDDFTQGADIFSGDLDKISEKKDDLFKDIEENKVEDPLNEAKAASNVAKAKPKAPLTERSNTDEDDLFSDANVIVVSSNKTKKYSEDMFPEDNITESIRPKTESTSNLFGSIEVSTKEELFSVGEKDKVRNISEDLFSGTDSKTSVVSKKGYAIETEKDNVSYDDDVFSSPIKMKEDGDDIFDNKNKNFSEGLFSEADAKICVDYKTRKATEDLFDSSSEIGADTTVTKKVSAIESENKTDAKCEDDVFSTPSKTIGDGDNAHDQENKNFSDLFSKVDRNTFMGSKIRNVSEDLFGFDGEAGIDSASSKKSFDSKKRHVKDEDDVFSSPIKSEDIDDIFGETNKALTGSKKPVPKPEKRNTKISDKKNAIVTEDKPKKGKKLDLFGDSKDSDEEDIFNKQKTPKIISVKEPVVTTSSDVTPNPKSKRPQSKDLFESSGESEDLTSKAIKLNKEKKTDPLFSDPLDKDDGLFSSQKPNVAERKYFKPESDSSSVHIPVKKTKEHSMKDEKINVEERVKNVTGASCVDDKVPHVSPPPLPSVGRKSPPRTLNLGRVVPFPKMGHDIPAMGNDFFGPNDAEEDRIVQAWMKGHPPPLRDSKVENTMNEVPDYQDSYSATKSIDDNSFFGDIPTGALLHSHGKERARIQSRRRLPTRKVRKTPTSVPSFDEPIEDERSKGVAAEVPYLATSVSKTSIEEDKGSQETEEEWSTPEAALTSPPSIPPRSNPLSPSTDEEQDFFDVLPVGRYPPPMGPPELSPFSDALNPSDHDRMVDDLWDKEDRDLFEDAGDAMGPKGYDSSWIRPASGLGDGEDSFREKPPRDNLFNDSVSNKVPKQKSVVSPAVLKDKNDDLFSDKSRQSSDNAGKEKKVSHKKAGTVVKEAKAIKKEVKQVKKGEMDDLWGEGFVTGSKLEDDLFSNSEGSGAIGDLGDIFQGQGDLFSSKKSSSHTSGKRNLGIAGGKSIGKSLSKLPPKTKDSLFDDDDDDAEDLFSPRPTKPASSRGSSSARKVSSGKIAAEQKSRQAASLTTTKASSNEESLFEDPLMVLKRKE